MITSLSFVLFLFCLYAVFFLVPKKAQWVVLLIASLGFYVSCSGIGILYVLSSAVITYLSARIIQSITLQRKSYIRENKDTLGKEEKAAYKKRMQKKSRCVMILAVLLNFCLLFSAKYWLKPVYGWIVPLGISFYTLQITGYIVDVYWENISAEKNFFKVLLFVSFFPQMTQGPIGDFEQLSGELFREHKMDYRNFSYGIQRMLWGFFKKMVIADALAPCVADVFADYASHSGIAVIFGAFIFMAQLYADFSGYMDIMCGYCEMLGIKLAENFNTPFFSKSVSEFWRRWHMTLGLWLRKYIYYPVAGSGWAMKSGERIKAKNSRLIPASIALVAVWLTTGLWHEFSWPYLVWGMLNGVVIIISLFLAPLYEKTRNVFHIKPESGGWRVFQIVRTSVLITLFEIIAGSAGVSEGIRYIGSFANPVGTAGGIRSELLNMIGGDSLKLLGFLAAFLGIAVLFAVSVIEQKKPVREILEKSLVLRIVISLVLLFCIVTLGVKASASIGGGFMYAGF